MTRGQSSFGNISIFLGIFLTVFIALVFNASAETTAQLSSLTGAGSGSATTPQNSLSTGAATYSIPVEVPQGRLGMSPNINIIYNSQTGNGWLGVGWNVDMGSIQRNTKNGLDYGKDDYVFAKNGASSELIKISGNEYSVKIEDGSFMRFFLNQNGWTVYDKTGRVYYYGQYANSRLVDSTGTKTFKWCLNKVQDSNGNYMKLNYFKDTNTDYREIYLQRIDYTGNTHTGLLPSNYVLFNRETTPKTDAQIVYYPNFPVKTAYRLSNIEVYGNGQLSNRYVMNFSYSPSTSRSLLSSVVQYGSDGISTVPPVSFTYQKTINEFLPSEDWGSLTTTGFPMAKVADVNGDGMVDLIYHDDKNCDMRVLLSDENSFLPDAVWGRQTSDCHDHYYQMADVNGDGMADIVYEDGIKNYHVMLSTGNGFTADTIWGVRIAKYSEVVPGFQMADVNGDGKADIVYAGHYGSYVHVLISIGRAFSADTSWGQRAQGFPDTYPSFQLVDVNRDGLPDFVYKGDDNNFMHVLLNAKNSFLADTTWGYLTSGYADNSLGFKMADVNGDGLPDVVYDSKNALEAHVLLNTGTNFLDDRIWGNKKFPNWGACGMYFGCSDVGFHMSDVNNDGLSDFVYSGNVNNIESYTGALVSNGSNFVVDIPWIRDNSMSTIVPSASADVNGDGLSDFVQVMWSDTNGHYGQVRLRKGPYPDLLSSIDNGIGGTTEIAYAPSTIYSNTLLPFVIQTVSSIALHDGLGNSSTTYFDYGNGYYDLVVREFRGFGYVKQTNPDKSTFETWIHQKDNEPDGSPAYCFYQDTSNYILDDEDYKGKTCHTEFREPWPDIDKPGNLLSETDIKWQRPADVVKGTYPVFVKTTKKEITNNVGGVELYSSETYTYDDTNGAILKVKTSGPDAEAITTTNTFQNYGLTSPNWLWRQTKTTVTGSVSGKMRETTYDYENNTGNLLWKEYWFNNGTNPRIEMTYWADGNLKTEQDAMYNPPTTYEYDDMTKTYVNKVTNALGFYKQYTYNYTFGVVDWSSPGLTDTPKS